MHPSLFPIARFDRNPDPLAERVNLELIGRLPVKSSREITRSLVGVGMETLDRDTFDPEDVYDLLEEAGFKWVRCQTGWMKCETVPGVYDFAWLDRIVDNLLRRGVQPWLDFCYGNPLYTPNPKYDEFVAAHPGELPPGDLRGFVGEVPLYAGERATAAWIEFVKATAAHFKGRVRHYEVWNETDHVGHFWKSNGGAPYPELSPRERLCRSAADFVKLVEITGKAVHESDPEAEIIANIAGHTGEYVRELARCGLSKHIDIFAPHFYGTANQAAEKQKIEFYRRLIQPRKMWMGEAGSPSLACSSLPHMLGASEYTQAKTLTRRVAMDLAMGMEVSSIYVASNLKSYWKDGSDSVCGLIYRGERKPKLAWYALQSLATLFEETEAASDLYCRLQHLEAQRVSSVIAINSIQTGCLRKRGIPMYFWFAPERELISFDPITLEGIFAHPAEDDFKDPVLIDPIRQQIYRLKDLTVQNWSGFLQAARRLPVADYPLFLTDLSAIDNFTPKGDTL